MCDSYPALLRRLIAGEDLSPEAAAAFVGAVMDGAYTPAQSAGLLVALAAKGETIAEIAGAARAMRERSLRVEHGLPRVVDVVGTGGDGADTINISTMAALVVAAAGVPVAKHGNRAASSACGSADVLEAAGMRIDLSPHEASRVLRACGFTFLFAPRYHPAMRYVGPVRRELGVRTIFNLLGPLTNPARATDQLVGVPRASLVEPIGAVMRLLGVRRGAVVHASSGMDEIAGDAPTLIHSFDEAGTRTWTLDPADYGVAVGGPALRGGSVEACRAAFCSILGGERSPAAKVVALNAAVVLHTLETQTRIDAALERTQEILASGAAWRVFERAREMAAT